MKEQIIAKAYAKSIHQLGLESKIDTAKELTTITEVINSSNNLENVLFLDLFTVEEKTDVLKTVLSKLNISPLTSHFLNFLMDEGRVSLFPLVFKEVVVLDDHAKGFMRGVIEGSDSNVDAKVTAKLTEYLEKKLNTKIRLDYKQNTKVTAGYKVTVQDLQLDATVDNQLEILKESILNN